MDALAAPYMGEDIDQVIGIESRGFVLGAAVAATLGCGFIPVRKPGKLPAATHREAYSLDTATTRWRFTRTRARRPAHPDCR